MRKFVVPALLGIIVLIGLTSAVFLLKQRDDTATVESTSDVYTVDSSTEVGIPIHVGEETVYVSEEAFYSYEAFSNDEVMQRAIFSIIPDVYGEYDRYSFTCEGLTCSVVFMSDSSLLISVNGETGEISVSEFNINDSTDVLEYSPEDTEYFSYDSETMLLPMDMFNSADDFKSNVDMEILIGEFYGDSEFEYPNDMYFEVNYPYVLVDVTWKDTVCAMVFDLKLREFEYRMVPANIYARGGG